MRLYLFPIFYLIFTLGYTQNTVSDDSLKEKTIKHISYLYFKESLDILKLSSLKTGVFCQTADVQNIAINYDVELHEKLHVYNSKIDAFSQGKTRTYFFLGSKYKFVINNQDSVYIIANYLEPEMKNISKRYWTYVADSTTVPSCITYYDLLEEYSAYYYSLHGAIASYKYMVDYKKCSDPELTVTLLNGVYNSYTAFYEFEIFMKTFLIHLRESKYEEYIKFKKDTALNDYHKLVYEKYQIAIKEIPELKRKMLNMKGITYENGAIRISPTRTIKIIDNILFYRNYLEKLKI